MHGYPWWFGFLLHPATWLVLAALLVAILGYIAYRIRRWFKGRATQAGEGGSNG